MSNVTDPGNSTPRKPVRLWPGIVIAVLMLLVMFVLPIVAPDAALVAIFGGVAGALAIAVWWLFFSRVPWLERLGFVAVAIVAQLVTSRLIHVSIAGAGQGMLFPVLGFQGMCFAFVVGAMASQRVPAGLRRATMLAIILIASGMWTGVRTDGISGAGGQWALRWTPTPEERLLAMGGDEPKPVASAPAPAATETPKELPAAKPVDESSAVAAASPTARTEPAATAAERGIARPGPAVSEPGIARPGPAMSERAITRVEWPGFRGPERDGVVRGVHIQTDWSASPPVQMWRRPIGPGWSSFAVSGDLLYTQEQRGDDEIVACYKVSTGEPVWRHRDGVRFYESNGGAGPRATPTLSHGRVYSFGATGIVNALDAATGRVVWSRNAASDTKRKVPDWGFASSPLVVDDVVIVAVSGSLVGYEIATGKPRWFGPSHGGSYSSPQRTTIDGVTQIVLLTGAGATSVAPATGELLWEHAWPGSVVVQPALMANGDIVINTIGGLGGLGTRRLAIAHGPGGWTVEERWTSNGLKPYFNDFVVHNGHAFGFDGNILACIDLEDGKRKWKGGRYGNGQLVLLPDEDLLLVLSEEGELALVSATTDKFTELARFPALEGKTWNHPVLVGNVLLVRNGQEMAAFRMTLAGHDTLDGR